MLQSAAQHRMNCCNEPSASVLTFAVTLTCSVKPGPSPLRFICFLIWHWSCCFFSSSNHIDQTWLIFNCAIEACLEHILEGNIGISHPPRRRRRRNKPKQTQTNCRQRLHCSNSLWVVMTRLQVFISTKQTAADSSSSSLVNVLCCSVKTSGFFRLFGHHQTAGQLQNSSYIQFFPTAYKTLPVARIRSRPRPLHWPQDWHRFFFWACFSSPLSVLGLKCAACFSPSRYFVSNQNQNCNISKAVYAGMHEETQRRNNCW